MNNADLFWGEAFVRRVGFLRCKDDDILLFASFRAFTVDSTAPVLTGTGLRFVIILIRTCGSLGQVLFSQALSLSLDATSCFLIVFQSVTNQIVLCLCFNRRVFRYENVFCVVLILSPLSVLPAVL